MSYVKEGILERGVILDSVRQKNVNPFIYCM